MTHRNDPLFARGPARLLTAHGAGCFYPTSALTGLDVSDSEQLLEPLAAVDDAYARIASILLTPATSSGRGWPPRQPAAQHFLALEPQAHRARPPPAVRRKALSQRPPNRRFGTLANRVAGIGRHHRPRRSMQILRVPAGHAALCKSLAAPKVDSNPDPRRHRSAPRQGHHPMGVRLQLSSERKCHAIRTNYGLASTGILTSLTTWHSASPVTSYSEPARGI